MYNIRLKPFCSQPTNNHLRGWVEDRDSKETLMEFHNTAAVDEGALAFVALMPEVFNFLNLVSREHELARLILDRWNELRMQLKLDATPQSVKDAVA
jgi:hypothetical protein